MKEGKNERQVENMLFERLNSVPEGKRIGVGLDIADYIIENAYLEDMVNGFDTEV